MNTSVNRLIGLSNGKSALVFRGKYSVFSNLYTNARGLFEIDGNYFVSSEQYYAHAKAVWDKQNNLAVEIMKETDPFVIKRLSGTVEQKWGPQKVEWRKVCVKVMEKAVFAKFSQNLMLKKQLLDTENKILVEGNKRDNFWGCGVDRDSVTISDIHQWPGENRMGQLLMHVREQVKTSLFDLNCHKMPAESSSSRQTTNALTEEGELLDVANSLDEVLLDMEQVSLVSENIENEPEGTHFTNRQYIVCQIIFTEGAVCHLLADEEEDTGPWFFLIPKNLLQSDFKSWPKLTDIVTIANLQKPKTKFQNLKNKYFPNGTDWYYKTGGKINWQMEAMDFHIIKTHNILQEVGLVMAMNPKFVGTIGGNLGRVSRVYNQMFIDGSTSTSLKNGSVIEINTVPLPLGARVGVNYFLPQNSPFDFEEDEADPEETIVVSAYRTETLDHWSWPLLDREPNMEDFYVFEQLLAAGAVAEKLESCRKTENHKLYAPLTWENSFSGSPKRGFAIFGHEISRATLNVLREDTQISISNKNTYATSWIVEVSAVLGAVKITFGFDWDSQPYGARRIFKDCGPLAFEASTWHLPLEIRRSLFSELSIAKKSGRRFTRQNFGTIGLL